MKKKLYMCEVQKSSLLHSRMDQQNIVSMSPVTLCILQLHEYRNNSHFRQQ